MNKYEDTLQDVETGELYTRETYEQALKETPTKEILLWKMPPEDTVEWLRLKGTTMGSGGMAAVNVLLAPWGTPWEEFGNQHPRGAGARTDTLRLGRENDIPLMQLLAILSYDAAKHLGDRGLKAMQERGRLQEGMVADIVVFDPVNVTENSTYTEGSKPSTGFKSVVVNGVQVVVDDKARKVFPGQLIRHEPAREGRFESVSLEPWESRYTVPGEHHGDDCVPVPGKSRSSDPGDRDAMTTGQASVSHPGRTAWPPARQGLGGVEKMQDALSHVPVARTPDGVRARDRSCLHVL